MKNQYCRNIAIFTKFMPKICHELDKYLPNFLSSIWQPCRYLCSDQTRQSIDCLSLSVSEPAALVTASLRDYVTFPSRFRADLWFCDLKKNKHLRKFCRFVTLPGMWPQNYGRMAWKCQLKQPRSAYFYCFKWDTLFPPNYETIGFIIMLCDVIKGSLPLVRLKSVMCMHVLVFFSLWTTQACTDVILCPSVTGVSKREPGCGYQREHRGVRVCAQASGRVASESQ